MISCRVVSLSNFTSGITIDSSLVRIACASSGMIWLFFSSLTSKFAKVGVEGSAQRQPATVIMSTKTFSLTVLPILADARLILTIRRMARSS